jgi:hypothetical protein
MTTMTRKHTRFPANASPEQIEAAAAANRHIFTYSPDETVIMTAPPDLRIGEQGAMEIREGVGSGDGWDADVWHPIQHVYHVGEHWVALEFTYINWPAQEAFKTLAVIPAEIYHSVM